MRFLIHTRISENLIIIYSSKSSIRYVRKIIFIIPFPSWRGLGGYQFHLTCNLYCYPFTKKSFSSTRSNLGEICISCTPPIFEIDDKKLADSKNGPTQD